MKFIRRSILSLACAAPAVLIHASTAASGDLDLDFSPAVNRYIGSLAVQADGKILIGGGFSEVSGMARGRLARLHADGSPDLGFDPNVGTTNSGVGSIAVQADGRIVIGGSFTNIGEVARTHLARLNADGTLDLGFNPVMERGRAPRVERIALQTDGKILIAGNFTMVNGVARNSLARLNANGTLDLDFHPLAESSNEYNVYDLALQPDGKILAMRVGGAGATFHDDFVRLNADGTVDTDFHVDTNDEIEALALQADGKILIGGDFSTVNGVPRSHLARINADGTLDLGFTPGAYGLSYIIAAQPGGKILIGGDLMGSGLHQLKPNGALDPDFNANVNDSVHSIGTQADGKILIAGRFTSVNGISRTNFARLLGQDASDPLVSLLARRSGNELVLSWTTNAIGFTLQSTLSLTPSVLWIDLTNAPLVIGGQFTVTNPFSGSGRFYRLRKL